MGGARHRRAGLARTGAGLRSEGVVGARTLLAWVGGARRVGRGQRERGRVPLGEGGAEVTHGGHQVLHGPAEPHSSAEAQLQILQGRAESWGGGHLRK